MGNEGYIRSNSRLIIFTILTTLFVLFFVLALYFYIYIDESSESVASEEVERIAPLILEDVTLSEDTITYIESGVIPTVSDVFEYEEVILKYYESSDSLSFTFITTVDSFGLAVSDLLDARHEGGFDMEKSEHYQKVAYYKIVEGMEEAYENLQDGFDEEVSFQFKTPNMKNSQFMSVSDFGILSGLFQEDLLFDIEPF